MDTATELQLVGNHVDGKIQFDTLGLVGAVIVYVLQSSGIHGTVENTLCRGIASVCGRNDTAATAQLEPVSGEFVVIGSCSGSDPVSQIQTVDQAVGKA